MGAKLPVQWSRLRRMDSDEVRTRLGQELAKRLDVALFRLGFRGLEPALRNRPQTHFLLGNDPAQARKRSELLRLHLPRQADLILREADEICRHQFRLLGFEKIQFGDEIDWHLDPVHAKRTDPLQPWYKINFLDFATCGDHKIIWELNRHQHLVTLAKAWLLSGDAKYVRELTTQWYAWQRANPYPLGVNWGSSLEVAFRSVSWLWVRNLLIQCPHLPPMFQRDLLAALQLHGTYVERYLSTYFSPNTHLIGEAFALFFVGSLCPQIASSKRWRREGWKILLQESQRQVRPDGLYFEQALHYHVYALDFFLHARRLAAETGLPVPEAYDATLKRMLEFLAALSAAGPLEGFGDDDGGRLFDPRRNRVEHMTDPLSLGSLIYNVPYPAAVLTEEAIWLFGENAITFFDDNFPVQTVPDVSAFPSGGVYVMRSSAPCPQQMMIDAGPQGTGRSGHGHADALSLRFAMNGHRYLIDPGTGCYISGNDDRDRFRGTAAHNTLRVDQVDQAIPQGPFAWQSLPNVQLESWIQGDAFHFFSGSHDGYGRLTDPVLHRRMIFHLKNRFWLIRDVATGQREHLLETFWHFAPDVALLEKGRAILARQASESLTSPCIPLSLVISSPSLWKSEIIDDLVSPAYGLTAKAPTVRIQAKVRLPEECAVLLIPAAENEIGNFSRIPEAAAGDVHGYRYQAREWSEFVFFHDAQRPWTSGVWSSDAKVLYCKLENGRVAQVIMISGSFVDLQGKRMISHASALEKFEWSAGQSQPNEEAQYAFSDFEFLDPVP